MPDAASKEQEISKAIADALLDPDVKNQFILDIDGYTKTTKMIQEKFRTVYDKLESFDREGLGDKGSTPLHETWGGFQTKFTELLNASRSLAGEMADSCYDYLSTIVKPAAKFATSRDIQEAAIEALVKEIGFFLEDGAEMEQKAIKTRDAFGQLASEIKTFRDTFDTYGQGRQTENLAKIAQLELDIGDLKGEIINLEVKLKQLGWAMAGTGIGTGILVTATAFFPLASLAIFVVGVLALVGEAAAILALEAEVRAKTKKIKDKEAEKSGLEAENARIDAIRTELAQMGQNEVADILGGLEFFRVLWAEVTADVQSIQGYLEKIKRRTDGVTDPKDYPESVYTFLKTGTTLYYGLSRGLKLYQIGVEKADTIKYGIPVD